jgi:methylated-DNA-protein-cysteine methyltransferase-like protein
LKTSATLDRAHARTVTSAERRARILAVIDSIPRGRVATYGQIAREAGLPRHARLVGRVLRELPPKSKIPWFRVVNSAARISPRPGGERQRRLLEREGVCFTDSGRIDFARFRWVPIED